MRVSMNRVIPILLLPLALIVWDQLWAQSFPTSEGWVPMTRQGVPVTDPSRDAPIYRDTVGESNQPAAFISRDETHLFFRLRLNEDPSVSPGNLRPYGWGVEFDTDRDSQDYELLLMVDGKNDEVTLQQNTEQKTIGDPSDEAELLLSRYPLSSHTRLAEADSSGEGQADYFLDWAIPLRDLFRIGFSQSTPFLLIFGASNNTRSLDVDLVGPSDEFTIESASSDIFLCETDRCTNIGSPSEDADGDGLTNETESELGTDPVQADTDQDGLSDFMETDGGAPIDSDEDGALDAVDSDSDNDGMTDAEERRDGEIFGFDVDQDGTFNWRDLDSEGDGRTDEMEGSGDLDSDGIPNYLDADEGDGSNGDTDEDGLSNGTEGELGINPLSPDTDDDGIGDFTETNGGQSVDTDGDGTIDALDVDSDNDNFSDQVEAGETSPPPVDTDDDGTPDFRDEDSDNDGLSDAEERDAGTNRTSSDSDGDEILDSHDETPVGEEGLLVGAGGCGCRIGEETPPIPWTHLLVWVPGLLALFGLLMLDVDRIDRRGDRRRSPPG